MVIIFFYCCFVFNMNLKRYPYYTSNTYMDFEFESEGPKGKIVKIVRFSLQNANGISYCNLGFGDLNKVTGVINDLAISDNKDRDKVLSTIGAIVMDFTEKFPDMIIYARGSTPARTRLYQMGIRSHYNDIESVLDVYGYVNGAWVTFERMVNYEAFIVLRKKV